MHLLGYDLPKATLHALEERGCVFFPVLGADDLSDAIHLLPKSGNGAGESVMDIDAIIIGVDGDADEITLREIRHAKYLGPVVVLTAKSIGHQTTLLAHGATMTMNTYADPMLIYAQLEALIRFGGRAPVGVRHVSGLIFDMHRKIVVHENGEPVHLTGKEYEVLELLMLRRGMVISKEQFLNHLYGGIDEPELKIVDVFICKLRKKLKTASGGKEIIETVWGRGYTIPHARQSEVIATA